MTAKDPAAPGFKQKAKKELKDFLIISLYLAFFFSALVTYTILLLRKYDVSTLNYTFAIINALVIAKVILIGEMMSLGKHGETRPLYQSVFYKAVIFSLFVLAFHFLEEFIKRLVHGKPFGTVWHEINPDELIGRSIPRILHLPSTLRFHRTSPRPGREEILRAVFHPRGRRQSGPSYQRLTLNTVVARGDHQTVSSGAAPGIRTSPGASPFNSTRPNSMTLDLHNPTRSINGLKA